MSTYGTSLTAIRLLCLVHFTVAGLIPNFCDFGDCGDQKLVHQCYYDQSWRDFNNHQPNSICHRISAKPNELDTNRELKRKRMWRVLSETDLSDRDLVVDCFRHHQQDLAEQCRGFTHGDLHEDNQENLLNREATKLNYYRAVKQEWNTAEECFYKRDWLTKPEHPCRRMTSHNGDPQSMFQAEQRNWAFKEILKRDEEDRKLVSHCFHYHQYDDYTQCQGVTFDRQLAMQIFKSDLRQRRISQLLADHYESTVTLEVEPNLRQVLSCLYNNTWIFDLQSVCYSVVLMANPTEHMSKLHRMYEQMTIKALVSDCFYNHRSDQYPACYLVSWTIGQNDSNLPTNAQHKKYWDQLVKAQKCATDIRC